MLPQIICRYTIFLSDITKFSTKKINVCDLEKNGVLHVKLTFETALIFYMNAETYFKSYFCRPYKDALPVSVTLSYLAKTFFNVRDLDKNSVLSPIFTFGTAPIYLYKR